MWNGWALLAVFLPRLVNLHIGVVTTAKAVLSVARSVFETALRVRRIASKVFWRGEGYMVDSGHAGLLTHYWTPENVISELRKFGFRRLGVWCNEHPQKRSIFRADWYYYAFAKGDEHRRPDSQIIADHE